MFSLTQRDWYFIAEQPAPAPHLARPEGRAALTHICYLLCSVSAALASSLTHIFSRTSVFWCRNVETGQAKTQLIAHDKEVYDIAFACGTEVFSLLSLLLSGLELSDTKVYEP